MNDTQSGAATSARLLAGRVVVRAGPARRPAAEEPFTVRLFWV